MTSAHMEFDTVAHKTAHRVQRLRSSKVRDLFSAATSADVISLSGGMPDVSLLPQAALRKATRDAIENEREIALQYGATNGRIETRRVICDLMRDIGVRCKPDEVMPTSGAQQALDLIGKVFLDPGDIVLMEGPTYLTAIQAFSAYEPDIRCIPFDDEGMRMDLLEAELERIGRHNPQLKFLYTIPNFQNPGGVTMVPERRKRLIELSHEYDFIVVEDDPYGRLRYDGGHMIPLKALDPNVIYLGTISKIFAPGLRIGWIVAQKDVISRVNLVKQGSDLCGSSLDQLVMAHYFTDTPWQRTLQKFIKVYRARRDAMLSALDEYFPPEATWTRPEGGLFVWVTLPEYVDTDSMLGAALEAGVTYVPGNSFFADGETGKNSMRINFSFETPENIEEAIRRLATVVEERLELYRAFIDAGAIRPARSIATDGPNDAAASLG